MVQTARVRDCSGYRHVPKACRRMSEKPDPQGHALMEF